MTFAETMTFFPNIVVQYQLLSYKQELSQIVLLVIRRILTLFKETFGYYEFFIIPISYSIKGLLIFLFSQDVVFNKILSLLFSATFKLSSQSNIVQKYY